MSRVSKHVLVNVLRLTIDDSTNVQKQVRIARKRPPPGFDVLQPTLEELERKMRDAENAAPQGPFGRQGFAMGLCRCALVLTGFSRGVVAGKKKSELMWPIFRIHHQRTRLVYEMYHRQKAISRDVYDYCLRERIADEKLIAKWKQVCRRRRRHALARQQTTNSPLIRWCWRCAAQPGYERLCCLHCLSTKDHTHGTTCVCRVPRAKLESGVVTECTFCGCRGCASGD